MATLRWAAVVARAVLWQSEEREDLMQTITRPGGRLGRPILLSAILVVLAAMVGLFVASNASASPADQQALVEVAPGLGMSAARDMAESHGATVVREIKRWGVDDGSRLFLVRSRGGSGKALAAAMKQEARVTRTVPDAVFRAELTPNDWWSGFWNLEKISARTAWNTNTGSSDVVVAVLDSGVDYTHRDLAANMWHNPDEVAGNGIDDDANGYVDDVYGIDAYSHDVDPLDGDTHGTYVSGILGAVGNNNTDIVGVVWDVEIMALRCLGGTPLEGTAAGAVEAAYYAINKRVEDGVNVVAINTSWGQHQVTPNSFLEDAVEAAGDAGIVWVASAGNDNQNADVNEHFPSGYDATNILSVGATDQADLRWSLSNWGATTVDLSAPGVDVYGTFPGNLYNYASGTSPSAAQVTGAVALMASEYPLESALQRVDRILSGVKVVPELSGLSVTGGRLDLNASLAADLRPTTQIVGADSAWHNASVAVTFNASDGTGIGVNYTEYSLDGGAYVHGTGTTVSTNGSHTLNYRSVDKAGNAEAAKQATIKVDKTAPDLTAPGLTSAWMASPATVDLAANDPLSGVALFEYRVGAEGAWTPVSGTAGSAAFNASVAISAAGTHEIQTRATDVAGNASSVASFTVKVDAAAPTVTASGADTAWHKTDVTVALSATDPGAPNASGVASVQYRAGTSGAWTEVAGASANVVVSATANDGSHAYQYRAADAAGNLSAVGGFTVKIDATGPTTSLSGATNGGYYRTARTLTLTAGGEVGRSGVASITYIRDGVTKKVNATTAKFTIGALPNGRHTVVYSAVDKIGNTSATKTAKFTIDSTGPVTYAASASGSKGKAISLRYKIADTLSPKAQAIKIVVKNSAGTTVKTFSPTTRATGAWYSVSWTPTAKGTYRYYVYAKDLAGNTQRVRGNASVVVR